MTVAPTAAERDATGWLVEMVYRSENNQPYPLWWHPRNGWTGDASKALRFAREIDAADYIKSNRVLGKPTEHMFIGEAA